MTEGDWDDFQTDEDLDRRALRRQAKLNSGKGYRGTVTQSQAQESVKLSMPTKFTVTCPKCDLATDLADMKITFEEGDYVHPPRIWAACPGEDIGPEDGPPVNCDHSEIIAEGEWEHLLHG